MQQCLLTGRAGFIGSSVARWLPERGHEVAVLGNCSPGYANELRPYPEAVLVRADIRHEAALQRAMAGKDAVFHLAASFGNKKPIDDPIFVARIACKESLTIFGNGEQTRGFYEVTDVVAGENPKAYGTFNVGTGHKISINRLVEILREITRESFKIVHGPARPGDVWHCTADATRLREVLGISPGTDIPGNLERYYSWVVSDPISIEKVLSKRAEIRA